MRLITSLRFIVSFLNFMASIASALVLNELIRSLNLKELTFKFTWVYALIGTTFLIIILAILQEFIQNLFTERLKRNITDRIMDFYVKNSLREFNRLDLETKFAYLSKQVDNIVFGISSFVKGVLIIMRIALFSIALFILVPITLGYTMPLILIMFLLPLTLKKNYKKIGEFYVLKTQQHNVLHQTVLNHIDAFKDRGQRKGIIDYYNKERLKNLNVTKRFVKLSALIGFVTNFGSGVAHTLTISITILLIGLGNLKFFILPAVVIFSFQIFTSTTEILQISLIAYISTKRNYKEMFAKNFNKELPKLLDLKDFESITLEGVKLSYNNKVIIEGLDLTINRGDKILIVGESGSGKSTLIRLLLGLVDVEGTILLNNRRLEGDVERASLFKLVNLSTSNNTFFISSIFENLTFNDNRFANEAERLIKAFRLSHLNLETEINDQDKALSLGETQRVGIIRNLLTRKPILLFDEATANLDKDNNALVINELLKSDSTILFVSHTISDKLAEKFDRKIRVSEGKIYQVVGGLNANN